MGSLSVCCLTNDPGTRVEAIMRMLRPVAEEIVVAVDSRVDPNRLGRYAQVADRLLRYEFVDSALQAMPWIFTQCTGEWILVIDGDEVPSPGLIRGIPELIGAREVFQYWMPIRWLYPDAGGYIAQPPWNSNAPRLVRNDPATLWHAGVSHTLLDSVFPCEYREESIYHLSLVVDDTAHRRAKLDRYLSIESSHERHILDGELEAFYLPEHDRRFEPTPVPVPAGDRAAIAQVLGAAGEELPTPASLDVPLWSWEMIERRWPRRRLSEEDCAGTIEPFERAPRLTAERRHELTVRVHNTGGETWPGMEREPWIRVAHRWREATSTSPSDASQGAEDMGSAQAGERDGWIATSLPASLAPGARALVPIDVEAPATPGVHTLELALAHEDRLYGGTHRRFAGTELAFEIEPAIVGRI
jgi:hypothetical protein